MSDTFRNHLKHLLFNDAVSCHYMGMNHNASDRSCVGDRFIDEVRSSDFKIVYDQTLAKYLETRQMFDANPTHHHPRKPEHIESLTRYMLENNKTLADLGLAALEYDVVTGGYWDNIEQIDEYVDSHATDEVVKMLVNCTA